MKRQLAVFVREAGDDSEFVSYRPVSGGSISQAFQVVTRENRYFVKCHTQASDDLFEKEAEGLKMMAATDTVGVPRVYHVSRPRGDRRACLVLEWLEGDKSADTEERLGRNLARMHRSSAGRFGLEKDNYLGLLVQPNGWDENWVSFYRDRRLAVMAEKAADHGRLGALRGKRMRNLLDNLDLWLTPDVSPSLLHGDLWGGNWLAGPGGEPYLIDPAVFYGDREMDVAFTELFGGFSAAFYDAYRECWPLSPGYEDRKELYQLYYLLVHLVHFGESYGPAVDRVLARYAG